MDQTTLSFRPQLKPYFRYEAVPPEGVILLSERGHFQLRGTAYLRLVPFLNGQYTTIEIIDHLRGQMSAAEIFYTIDLLSRDGYVTDANLSISCEQSVFWESLNIDSQEVLLHLQDTTVSVVSLGETTPNAFLMLLSSLGVHVSNDGQFCVVLTDDYLHDKLETLNVDAVARQRPWMLVKPVGAELWIGPLFLPGETGCWECLAHRLRGSRKIESYLQEKTKVSCTFPFPPAALPSTIQTAYSLAATEIVKWIVCRRNKEIEGQLVSLDVRSLTKNNHRLTRRPQCPRCGNSAEVALQQFEPLVLQSCKKAFTTDGGHRVFSPEETVEGLASHISPITGLISFLQPNVTWMGERSITPSYVAAHNFVQVSRDDSLDLNFLRASLRSASGGKGRGATQAKASAIGEAIERYSGVFQGDEARIRARYKELGNTAVHPNSCMLFSESQLINRHYWNATDSWCSWVPEPFNENEEIEWSPGWSLTYGKRRWLPTAYCYYSYSRKHTAWFARADSNGCAAGNTKEEAILQGYLELVERDGVALWWYNRLKRPTVDLASFHDPYVQELQPYYNTLHRDLWVLDITSDLGIPTFAAVSRRNDKEEEDIIFGFGSHLDPHLALLRALTEVNQSLPAASSIVDENNICLDNDPQTLRWWKTATIENQPYLVPDKTLRAKTQADYPHHWSDDLSTDIMTCVTSAQEKNLETIVLDQTRPDTQLSVIKVIVPGLRHFWARFAPGRLYDIPVQMKWMEKPLTEDDLNPQHIFF